MQFRISTGQMAMRNVQIGASKILFFFCNPSSYRNLITPHSQVYPMINTSVLNSVIPYKKEFNLFTVMLNE